MNETKPIVALVMGSDSDWPTMEEAALVLREFNIPFHAQVLSAHRMPIDMIEFGREAAENGYRVIIAAAGGAAHLPGMLASVTTLPVIGVPVKLKTLDGLDSLLSIVQMPAGVPVATVSIGGAKNAALLAARILATQDTPKAKELQTALKEHQKNLRQLAIDKGKALNEKLSTTHAD